MDLRQIAGIGLTFVIIAVVLSVGAMITNEFKGQITDTNSTAYQIVTQGEESLKTFGNWLPLIAIVVVASVVIGLIIGVFSRQVA